MPEVAEAPEEVIDIPASEKVAINRMADKFKDAMKGLKPEPAAIAPVEAPKPAEKPAAPPAPAPVPAPAEPKPAAPAPDPAKPTLPADTKGQARQAFEALEGLKNKYQKDYETLKPQYDSLSTEKASAIAERDQAKAELAEAKKGTAEHAELKAQLEQAQKLVDEFYVERSPQFQAHFGQKFQAAKLAAAKAGGPEHAAKITAALELPPSKYREEQIKAIGLELDDWDRGTLLRAYGQLTDTEVERDAELAKAPENRKKLAAIEAKEQQENASKRAAHFAQMRTGWFDTVEKNVAAELTGFPEADAIKAVVRKVIFNEATSDEYTGILEDGVRYRRYKSSITEKDELITKLQAQVNELQSASPSLQSNGAAPTKKSPPPMDNSDMGEKFRKARDGK